MRERVRQKIEKELPVFLYRNRELTDSFLTKLKKQGFLFSGQESKAGRFFRLIRKVDREITVKSYNGKSGKYYLVFYGQEEEKIFEELKRYRNDFFLPLPVNQVLIPVLKNRGFSLLHVAFLLKENGAFIRRLYFGKDFSDYYVLRYDHLSVLENVKLYLKSYLMQLKEDVAFLNKVKINRQKFIEFVYSFSGYPLSKISANYSKARRKLLAENGVSTEQNREGKRIRLLISRETYNRIKEEAESKGIALSSYVRELLSDVKYEVILRVNRKKDYGKRNREIDIVLSDRTLKRFEILSHYKFVNAKTLMELYLEEYFTDSP